MELILIPILAGVLAAFAGKNARWVALLGSLAAFALVWLKLQGFKPDGGFQFIFDRVWFSKSIHFKTGIDGISMVMLLLTNLLVPVIIVSSLNKLA